jgi:hypothetical protein
MDRAEVQEMAALVPTEKVTWTDTARDKRMHEIADQYEYDKERSE